MKKYDVIVIGSGGGTKLAAPVARLGKTVAVIEEDRWGGTCLNRGCIPSKMLIHPANIASHIKDASKFNIDAKYKSVDFAKLVRRINRTTDANSKDIPGFYDTVKNLDYYHGHASFVSDKVVEVNGKKITAKRIFIATGARPSIPPIPGLEGTPYMTSTQALRNRKLPKTLLVIGGGYIACELGHAYAALGSDTQFLVRSDVLLRHEDSTIRDEFKDAFAKRYKVRFKTNTEKVEYTHKKFRVTISKNGKRSTITADALIVATGVMPNSDDLGLKNTKIKTKKRGFIKVNKFMETSVKGVYAMGDVAGNFMFRHSVNFEGEFLFDSLYVKKRRLPINYPPMPHAVFTFPEIGSVGATEEQLIEKGINYVVGLNAYAASAMGMARLSDEGIVKLLFHKKTKKLLGAHILGDDAATMIHQLIYAMTFNATIDDLMKMIYIHPALPEIVRNAVRRAKDQF